MPPVPPIIVLARAKKLLLAAAVLLALVSWSFFGLSFLKSAGRFGDQFVYSCGFCSSVVPILALGYLVASCLSWWLKRLPFRASALLLLAVLCGSEVIPLGFAALGTGLAGESGLSSYFEKTTYLAGLMASVLALLGLVAAFIWFFFSPPNPRELDLLAEQKA